MAADIEYAQSSEPKARIFISYSRKDMAFADKLEDALKARGFEPLIDRSEIYAFEDWWKRIEALIGGADTVVFVLSPDAVKSDIALKEVTCAASLNKRLAPIVYRRVDDSATPQALRRLNFIFFDEADRFEAGADQLAEALKTDISWIRQHTDFGELARRWSSADRPGGMLLRSPVLEEAESWIASRPRGAPEPTAETQGFVAESRKGASRRRNVLTGSLAAGLVVALLLAGLAYWQREVAIQQQQIAEQQRKRAEDTLATATETANGLVFDLAQRFRDALGIPANLVKDILDKARALQEQLIKSGQITPKLKRSEASALIETVDTLLTIGDTAGALAAALQARQILTDLLAGNPGNTGWQRDRAVSLDKVGDVQVVQGDLAGALKSYHDSLNVRDRLAKSDPGNAGWQRDLAVSYSKIANVQVAQGDLGNALTYRRNDLAITDRLAKSHPGNADWQRDLAVSLNKVGDVQVAQGDLAGALPTYRDGLAIRERLAKSDPGNAQWQYDLGISNERTGSVLMAQGDLAGALKSYQAKRDIISRLVKSDASNFDWQRDLSVSLNEIGDVQAAQGDRVGALTSYRESLAIIERLAKSDPGNAGWQRDLVVSCAKLAILYGQSNDRDNALIALREGKATMDHLVKLSPDNARWKRDLAWFDDQIAALNK